MLLGSLLLAWSGYEMLVDLQESRPGCGLGNGGQGLRYSLRCILEEYGRQVLGEAFNLVVPGDHRPLEIQSVWLGSK